ncbi:hypothetical protein TWF281_002975 [Arthrobotrys megalospora]
MPYLPLLPTELIYQIGQEIDDEDDFLALRLTCKALNTKARELHLNSIYRCRRIYLVPAGVDNIAKISRHPSGVNLRVRHIIISDATPYSKQALRKILESAGQDNGAHLDLKSDMEKDATAYGLELEKTQLQRSGSNIDLLASALSDLPRIQHLELEGFSNAAVPRSELNLLYPSLGLKPGSKVPEGLRRINRAEFGLDSRISKRGVAAALKSGLGNLEKLSNGNHSYWLEDFTATRISAFSTAFPKLKSIDIGVAVARGLSHTYSYCDEVVGRWLEAFGKTLRELRYRNCVFRYGFGEPTLLPVGTGLHQLRVFAFSNSDIEIDNLTRFLKNCKDSLEEFELKNCYFDQQPEDHFRLLHYIRGLPRLNRFEYEAEGTDKADCYYFPTKLTVLGLWSLPTATCNVEILFNVRLPPIYTSIQKYKYNTSKKINLELERHTECSEFWDSVTDGKWKCPDLLSTIAKVRDRRLRLES